MSSLNMIFPWYLPVLGLPPNKIGFFIFKAVINVSFSRQTTLLILINLRSHEIEKGKINLIGFAILITFDFVPEKQTFSGHFFSS